MNCRAVERKLDQVYKHVPVIPFDSGTKLVVMSDCHRGQGNAGDNFLANQAVCFGALEYYFQKGFTYVELGDGDELWENRKDVYKRQGISNVIDYGRGKYQYYSWYLCGEGSGGTVSYHNETSENFR